LKESNGKQAFEFDSRRVAKIVLRKIKRGELSRRLKSFAYAGGDRSRVSGARLGVRADCFARRRGFDSRRAPLNNYQRVRKVFMKVKSQSEINIIRAKILVGDASKRDMQDFLYYVSLIESLVQEASDEDFYGTEGWRHRIGME
jgi:hypothetical protein